MFIFFTYFNAILHVFAFFCVLVSKCLSKWAKPLYMLKGDFPCWEQSITAAERAAENSADALREGLCDCALLYVLVLLGQFRSHESQTDYCRTAHDVAWKKADDWCSFQNVFVHIPQTSFDPYLWKKYIQLSIDL